MDVEHADPTLEELEMEANSSGKWFQSIVKAFRKRMQTIRAAIDERDFYSLKSLHFEKLAGQRAHQHSMRLNDQFRLVLELKGDAPKKVVRILSIEDYH